MSYHIYTTEGIILEGRALGDADKYYSIFTKELGLVFATAKSVRKPESKLRYSLSDMSFSTLSFVRGKHSWKIISARDIENVFHSFSDAHDKRTVVLRILAVLRKLLQGEEKNEVLYTAVWASLEFLKSQPFLPQQLKAFECIIFLRILTVLGYAKHEAFASFVETSVWSMRILDDAVPHIPAMVREINASLEASQL